jgi:hypothetical protein
LFPLWIASERREVEAALNDSPRNTTHRGTEAPRRIFKKIL